MDAVQTKAPLSLDIQYGKPYSRKPGKGQLANGDRSLEVPMAAAVRSSNRAGDK